MDLILFIHQDGAHQGEALYTKMTQYFGVNSIQAVHTMTALTHILKQPGGRDHKVYVLLAESRHRLQELYCLFTLLDGRRIVLVLPDDTKETISLTHQFYPRFFTYSDTAYDDLCAVLYKMMNHTQTHSSKEGKK
ncbi:MAG: hypothetical protein K9K63_14480 [Desulfotignum sp.]|nr:hypothetical protein [Desulfotignum sp.]MCF8138507.1 hypothetical protein [Desulfotignum sp.]